MTDRKELQKLSNSISVKELILDSYSSIKKRDRNKNIQLVLLTNFGCITGSFIFPLDSEIEDYKTSEVRDLAEKETDLSKNTKFLFPNLEEINENDSVLVINNATIKPFNSNTILKLDSILVFTHQIVGFSYEAIEDL